MPAYIEPSPAGWSGKAAGKASEAVRKYTDGAGQLTTAAHLLSLELAEMYCRGEGFAIGG